MCELPEMTQTSHAVPKVASFPGFETFFLGNKINVDACETRYIIRR